MMLRLADLMREHYAGTPEPSAPRSTVADMEAGDLSYYFTNLVKAERREHPEMRLLAAQPTLAVAAHEAATWRRLLYGVADKRLLESIHFCDGFELKIVSRGRPYAYRWQTPYGRHICYIPVSDLTGATWMEDPRNAAAVDLVLRTAGGEARYVFGRDNPTAGPYRDFLACLPGLKA